MSIVKIFEDTNIRAKWNDDEDRWYFVVIDVIQFLTDSPNPSDYWYRLKKRELDSSGIELSTVCRELKFTSTDGKKYKYECADNEGVFRILQSVSSPKAEPFKRWLAQLGKERIDEIEQPEKGIDRAKGYFEQKGRGVDWTNIRMNSIATRNELTDYWKKSGISESKEYAILTNQIYSSTFGVTALKYKTIKGLAKGDNLRDHMSPLELVVTMLAEQTSKEIAEAKGAKEFYGNQQAIKDSGEIVHRAVKDIEQQTGKPIVSKDNFKAMDTTEKTKEIIQGESKSMDLGAALKAVAKAGKMPDKDK